MVLAKVVGTIVCSSRNDGMQGAHYLLVEKTDVNVSILDLSGKDIANFYKVTNNQTLSNAFFQSGIYIVKISEGIQVFCTKLVLQ